MAGTEAFDFEVARSDLSQTRFAPATPVADLDLDHGQVLLGVDTFALTANNITYAVFGDIMSYWRFFPAPEGWGRVPVWGFANVLRTHHPAIAQGERIYGYFPMSTYLMVRPGKVTAAGFADVSEHRSELHALYNQYSLVAGDHAYDPAREAEQMLFRPLFTTGFLIDDFLADADFFGARQIVISSASSKTAMSLALSLSSREERPAVIGLTSARNVAFVSGLGCYDRVLPYAGLDSLDAATPTVFVDMAGDGEVLADVHRRFGDKLRHSCQVGGTHWDRIAMGQQLAGPAPTLFFAPAQVAKRMKDWGAAGLQERIGHAWRELLGKLDGWIHVERAAGRDQIDRVYKQTLAGKADPSRGYVLAIDA